MSAAPVLNIQREGEAQTSRELNGEMVLGRSDDCGIQLDDRAISRHHAVFRPVIGGVQVERRSQFGLILVNGTECSHALVKQGDVIEIGPYRVRLAETTASGPTVAEHVAMPDPQLEPLSIEESNQATLYGTTDSEELFEGGSEDQPFAAPEPVALSGSPLESAPGSDPFASAGLDSNTGEIQLAESPFAHSNDGFGGLSLDPPPTAESFAPLESLPESISEDAETRVAPVDALNAKLLFGPDDANVTEFAVGDQEISMGRGKECDVVLNNKKASRKHAVIRKLSGRFVLEDMASANGTVVNGKKIKSYELTGDDVIRIGAQEFRFQVSSPEYVRQEGHFVAIEEASTQSSGDGALPDFALSLDQPQFGVEALDPAEAAQAASAMRDLGARVSMPPPLPQLPENVPRPISGTQSGVMGIPGLAGATKRQSLVEKFRALPPARQVIWAGIILGALYFGLYDEPQVEVPKPKTVATATAKDSPSGPTYDSLTPEQKRFVETQYALGFDHFKNKDYDKSLFEIRRIFTLINDYKDSREIERYAIEGKRKLEAFEAERKKQEEEQRIKARVAQLVDDARSAMSKKDYASASDMFYEILAIEPDNAQVAEWKKTIEQWEEEQKTLATQRQVEAEINRRAWEEFHLGMTQKTAGKYRTAIATFGRVKDIGATDKKVRAQAIKMITACLSSIAAVRDPLIAQAKEAEGSGEFKLAFDLYRKVTKVDPDSAAGYSGMRRLRDILRDRARILYAEGVMAESYSDFDTAKKKFAEVMEKSPEDDLYFERAQRKMSNYFNREPASNP